ncbi:hypothetical protein CJU90_3138 [Yarrowia sp. C11]|nr:hypothetical protein CKK34_4587 [Yarrowia sp. E02]KAG5369660.1 hypothetical protein CJU90_3138 [Yarrowia sp. C11]
MKKTHSQTQVESRDIPEGYGLISNSLHEKPIVLPREVIRDSIFERFVPFSHTAPDNDDFYLWARQIVRFRFSTELIFMKPEFFEKAHEAIWLNVKGEWHLRCYLQLTKITNPATLDEFLGVLLDYLLLKDPVTIKIFKAAKAASDKKRPQPKSFVTQNNSEKQTKRTKTDTDEVDPKLRAFINEKSPTTYSKIVLGKQILAMAIREDPQEICPVCISQGHCENMALYIHPILKCKLAEKLKIKTKNEALNLLERGDLIIKTKKSLGIHTPRMVSV